MLYRSDLLPDAIYDWINMLTTISWLSRIYYDITSNIFSLFNGHKPSRIQQKVTSLTEHIQKLEHKNEKYSNIIKKYKANEIFDSISDVYDDPYPLLHSMPPDKVRPKLKLLVRIMTLVYLVVYMYI